MTDCDIRDCDNGAEYAVAFENIIGPVSVLNLCGYHLDGIQCGEVCDPE